MPDTTNLERLLRPSNHRCPSCSAPPGTACETPGGRPRKPHRTRDDLANRARQELERLRAWESGCTPGGTRP